MPELGSAIELLGSWSEEDREAFLLSLPPDEMEMAQYEWHLCARDAQRTPPGDWLTWLIESGRGWGKTRTGGEWVCERAEEYAGRWIALIAKNPADARDYMIEGPGGILKNTHPALRPTYEPSKRRLTWPNGSWATIFSSEEPDQLRGFSGDTAWLDEFAKWKNPRECWDNLAFGMREISNDRPRKLVTTTPRPLPLLEEIEEDPDTHFYVGTSYENRANLSSIWLNKTLQKYEGTRLGEQEIHGIRLEDVEGRVYSSFSKKAFPDGNVCDTIEDTGGDLFVGMDFNVNPMSAVVAVKAVDECHVIDSISIDTSNTEEMAQEISDRYPRRKIIVCPDPSGKARKTSAKVGVTDFTILERAGFTIRAPKAAPPVVDRINNSQAMYRQTVQTPDGPMERRRALIHPRAKSLIKALSGLCYKEGTSQPDKGSGFDHPCDAFDYLLWQEFNTLVPVRRPVVRTLRI